MTLPFGGKLVTARAVYDELASSEREHFLCEARRVCEVSIPHLVPPEGYRNSNRKLPTPYQSLGARGVNNLSSKLLLSLFPPNTSFFKLAVLEEKLADAGLTPKIKGEVEESLVAMEKRVQRELELATFRPRAFEAFRHLVVSGNALMHVPDGQSWRVFHLDQYVVRRDALDDKIRVLVVRESVSPDEVKPRMRPEDQPRAYSVAKDNLVDLYTAVWWDEEAKVYRSFQEAAEVELDGTATEYAQPDDLPWIPLRLTTDEDNYGRSIGGDLLGDLVVSDALSQALADGASAASRLIGLVRNGAGVTGKELNRAQNGTWLTVNDLEGIKMLQAEKSRDWTFVTNVLTEVNGRLAQSFLLNSSVQRNAERVTAEEIRFVAQELEDALGGTYSNLSQEFQLPLARRLLRVLTKRKVLPTLPKGLVSPTVVTGLEALGRGQDFSRIRLFLQAGAETLGPQVMQQYTNPREIISRLATSLSIDTLNLVRSEQEVSQAQNQAQLQTAVSELGPAAIQAVAKNPGIAGGQPPQQ